MEDHGCLATLIWCIWPGVGWPVARILGSTFDPSS